MSMVHVKQRRTHQRAKQQVQISRKAPNTHTFSHKPPNIRRQADRVAIVVAFKRTPHQTDFLFYSIPTHSHSSPIL